MRAPAPQRNVQAYLDQLVHPQKPLIEAIRQVILAASPTIHEGIKWNAPSFRTTEYFATFNLHARSGANHVWLILHTGARANADTFTVPDPDKLLEWLARDRARITFVNMADLEKRRAALTELIQAWAGRIGAK